MPSYEHKLLTDFLVVPAGLGDFMTLRQFTEIFPKSQRSNPTVKELYRELYAIRESDVAVVRQDITDQVKRSRPLRRQCARQRLRVDHAMVAGIDQKSLETEQEACS